MIKKKISLGIAALLILASLTILFIPATVEAHSPSDVSIDYDIEEEELTVSITHSVDDPQSHYIYNVVVEVNGETEIDEEYDEQPDDTSFEYTYDLVAEPGSTIEATAYCNIDGSGSDTFEVEDDLEDVVVDEFTVNGEDDFVRVGLEEELVIYAEVTNNMVGEEANMAVRVVEDGVEIHSWSETVPAGESGVIEHVYDPHPEAWYPSTYEVILFVSDGDEETIHERTIEVEVYDEDETYELTVNIEGEGTVTVEWNDNTEVVEDSDTFNIAVDTDVTLTAEAEEGWEFVDWTGTDETGEQITITLEEDMELTANFEEDDDPMPGFTIVILLIAVLAAIVSYNKKRSVR